ncbi:hypothetical protein [Thermoplasma volcanium]|uniref:hypothetical protein n=1 Tax=Thermoplasma volcanium TaxID=50339 RepID=UPI0012EA0D85|nr:hypothetical protein [Thermoplasma volcanium]
MKNCDLDYDVERLASLSISLRSLDLCGYPLLVSAVTSLSSMMDGYLYSMNRPEIPGAGSTEMAYVPNKCGA